MYAIILNRRDKRVAIKVLRAEGKPIRKISSTLDPSPTTVSNWLISDTLEDKKISGRPRSLPTYV